MSQRSDFQPTFFAFIAFSSLAMLLATSDFAQAVGPAPKSIRVYVGGGGLDAFELDPTTGKPTEIKPAADSRGVGFLAISPNHKFLYATGGSRTKFPGPDGKEYSGTVTAYSIDPKTRALTKLNSQPTGGNSVAHVALDHAGKNVLAVDYDAGPSTVCFPVNKDGSLGERSAYVPHEGSSVNKSRQRAAHPHSVNLSADDKFAIAADLGADKLFVYRFDPAKGTLTPNDPPSVSTKPGAGPRHFSFHPNGKYAFNNNELDLTAVAYKWDGLKGTLTPINTVSTLPEGTPFSEKYSTAETLVHPSGKFVYVSNRGHNTIAIFHVNEDGSLKPAGHQSTQGEIPRNFGIDPTGKFLLAANQDSDNVVIFSIDQENGSLKPTGDVLKSRKPICVRMYALE